MERKSSSKSANDQRTSQALDQMRLHMGKAGFVEGSQIPYVRELGRFAAKLDRKGLDEATVADGRRYLTRLKQSGPSATLFSHASASLRFYFEDVRGLAWKPLSPLRLRMIEDMQMHGVLSASVRTDVFYEPAERTGSGTVDVVIDRGSGNAQETGQFFPAFEDVQECLAQYPVGFNQMVGKILLHPPLHILHGFFALLLMIKQSFLMRHRLSGGVCIMFVNLFVGLEYVFAFRRKGGGNFNELAPAMAVAVGFDRLAFRIIAAETLAHLDGRSQPGRALIENVLKILAGMLRTRGVDGDSTAILDGDHAGATSSLYSRVRSH